MSPSLVEGNHIELINVPLESDNFALTAQNQAILAHKKHQEKFCKIIELYAN